MLLAQHNIWVEGVAGVGKSQEGIRENGSLCYSIVELVNFRVAIVSYLSSSAREKVKNYFSVIWRKIRVDDFVDEDVWGLYRKLC